MSAVEQRDKFKKRAEELELSRDQWKAMAEDLRVCGMFGNGKRAEACLAKFEAMKGTQPASPTPSSHSNAA